MVKKFWQSKLSSFNKVITHTISAIPVPTTTVGRIIDWRIEGINKKAINNDGKTLFKPQPRSPGG